jgi:CDP-glycerol glycerophosphotransferase
MEREFPYLENVFSYYNKYNKVVSVSEKTMELNRDNLCDIFNVEKKVYFL